METERQKKRHRDSQTYRVRQTETDRRTRERDTKITNEIKIPSALFFTPSLMYKYYSIKPFRQNEKDREIERERNTQTQKYMETERQKKNKETQRQTRQSQTDKDRQINKVKIPSGLFFTSSLMYKYFSIKPCRQSEKKNSKIQRERHVDKNTWRQKGRKTKRHRDRQTYRVRQTETDTQERNNNSINKIKIPSTLFFTPSLMHKYFSIKPYRQNERQRERHGDKRTWRHRDRQTDTDKQTNERERYYQQMKLRSPLLYYLLPL